MTFDLTARQQHILWATVRSYIVTAEPVGSKSLADTYDLGVSTATIRNAMAVLEDIGLLFQPHTSAGRVPSDTGYRVYVDTMLDDSDALQKSIGRSLSQQLESRYSDNLDSLLHNATQILAALSGYIALATAPAADSAIIRHLQIVSVDRQRLMAILVTDAYQTHSILLNWEPEEQGAGLGYAIEGDFIPYGSDSPETARNAQLPPLSEDDLQVLSNFLTLQLRGRTVGNLMSIDWEEATRIARSRADWLRSLLDALARKYLQPAVGQVFMGGVTELMRQPEFAQTQRLRAIVQLLEDNQTPLGTVLTPLQPGRVAITIGAENPLQPIRHCSLVSAGYSCGTVSLGTVSLLGPTRMSYERAIAAVKATARHLSSTLNRAYS
ncbi:MAG: heat-inducible transcriptional repressor HrcA [Cyanobacteria bacterium J06639_1]